jgi:hypothetical protein
MGDFPDARFYEPAQRSVEVMDGQLVSGMEIEIIHIVSKRHEGLQWRLRLRRKFSTLPGQQTGFLSLVQLAEKNSDITVIGASRISTDDPPGEA